MQGPGREARVKGKALLSPVQAHIQHYVGGLQFFIKTAEDAVDKFVQRYLDPLRSQPGILQATERQQLQYQLIQFTNVSDQ